MNPENTGLVWIISILLFTSSAAFIWMVHKRNQHPDHTHKPEPPAEHQHDYTELAERIRQLIHKANDVLNRLSERHDHHDKN